MNTRQTRVGELGFRLDSNSIAANTTLHAGKALRCIQSVAIYYYQPFALFGFQLNLWVSMGQ